MQLRSLSLCALASVSLLLASCGENKPEQVKVPEKPQSEVTGKVTVNGKAVEGVNVGARPVTDASLVAGGSPSGKSDAQGNFTLSTAGKPGVPVGEYVLTFDMGTFNMMRKQNTGDKLRGAYSDYNKNAVNPAFKFTAKEGAPVTVAPIDLTMEETAPEGPDKTDFDLKR